MLRPLANLMTKLQTNNKKVSQTRRIKDRKFQWKNVKNLKKI
jgi:hypothetical protein